MEFLIWKKEDDHYLVNHSRFWSKFDDQYGRTNNQELLSKLPKYYYRFQSIKEHNTEKVYQEFEQLIQSDPMMRTFEIYQGRIGHQFAVIDNEQFQKTDHFCFKINGSRT